MSAFDNGVVFLAIEQYATAEACFDRVTREFPNSSEAWANLGFAALMQYCDKLDAKDLRQYGIGPFLTAGFYRRAKPTAVLGRDQKLWIKEVNALHRALEIEPDLTLAKANLGLAFLVRPAGTDLGEATRLLQEAAKEADKAAGTAKRLEPTEHAAILVLQRYGGRGRCL
jgi:tetratricopeptide (TPR) repeat protein